MATLTLSFVNEQLQKIGAKEILVKGLDFYFFAGGNSDSWKQNIVKVKTLNSLTLEEWLDFYKLFSKGGLV